MAEHIVTSFDDDLKDLTRRIAEVGGLAERSVDQAVRALISVDLGVARKVIEADDHIDALQREIEEKAILVIARRQPMAQDLREVMAAIHIANDLERVGDLAKNTAKRVIAIDGQFQPKQFVHGVEHLADLALEQLKDVLDAYAAHDLEQALAVWKRDNEIDVLYTSLFRELLTYMMEDPRNISFCTHLLFCAKNIERIGDHATNIAEIVHYVITGVQLADERPKKDTSSLTSIDYKESLS
jgi:phosphate transport system protein